METEEKDESYCRRDRYHHRHHHHSSSGGGVYGLGFIGALFYYFQNIHSLEAFLIALFKSLFWPAFMVFEVLKRLHM